MASREALRQEIRRLAPSATITRHDERSWSSITFAGTRHLIELVFEDAADGDRFIEALPQHRFNITGQLAVGAYLVEVTHTDDDRMTVTIEVLLLEND